MPMISQRLKVENFGPIRLADIEFGDLTVLVGPQATGKSLFFQLLKLLVDLGPICQELKRFSLEWRHWTDFLELYFGEGLSSIYRTSAQDATRLTRISADGQEYRLDKLVGRKGKASKKERLFLIPGQRVLVLRDGITHPFTDYRVSDPFVVREFSQTLHWLVQSELANSRTLFPMSKRLKPGLRRLLEQRIFRGFQLKLDTQQRQRRIVLEQDGQGTLSYLVWSAGQREFVPLLLGLYWLMPAGAVSRRENIEWVVIEEPEMGLHPSAIVAVLALVMELLRRRYRVCVSTHSSHVLDVVWCLRKIQALGGSEKEVRELLGLTAGHPEKQLAEQVLKKTYKVYYFQTNGEVENISDLDPDSENPGQAGWGGLTEFSGKVCDIVAQLTTRSEVSSKTISSETNDDFSASAPTGPTNRSAGMPAGTAGLGQI